MAELRPLTARDIKQNVEGYQEMSDEAFARRFYSDRAELLALGVPLDSQRDEFTGEELYTLRSERYFLPPLELTDEELAALQTCLYLLEGQFAYAEQIKTFRPARIRGEIRLATRRERDFRLPEDFDADQYRLPPPWQVGEIEGEARIELVGDAAWWVERAFGQHGRIEDDVFVTG